ncbi:hypothetical protein ABG768_003621, partial [Culter alburnus]
ELGTDSLPFTSDPVGVLEAFSPRWACYFLRGCEVTAHLYEIYPGDLRPLAYLAQTASFQPPALSESSVPVPAADSDPEHRNGTAAASG